MNIFNDKLISILDLIIIDSTKKYIYFKRIIPIRLHQVNTYSIETETGELSGLVSIVSGIDPHHSTRLFVIKPTVSLLACARLLVSPGSVSTSYSSGRLPS